MWGLRGFRRCGRLLVDIAIAYRQALIYYRSQQIGQWAGALSFISILALVPLLTVVITVLSSYPELSRTSIFLRQYIASELLPNTGAKVIVNYLFSFSQNAGKLGGLGLAFLVLTAVLLLNRIEAALNHLWNIHTPRHFALRLKNYWIALTFGPLAIGLLFYLMSESLTVSYGWLGVAKSTWRDIVGKLLSVFLLTLLIGFAFVSLPNRQVSWRRGLFAAFLATINLLILQQAFELYLRLFPSFALIYGTFATVPIFLVWVYGCWQMFLLGACMHVYWDQGTINPPTNEGESEMLQKQFDGIMRLMGMLWRGYQQGLAPMDRASFAYGVSARPSWALGRAFKKFMRPPKKKSPSAANSTEQLAHSCGFSVEATRHWLMLLQQNGWVIAQGGGDEEERWFWVRDPQTIAAYEWQNKLLGIKPTPADSSASQAMKPSPTMVDCLRSHHLGEALERFQQDWETSHFR